MRRHCGTGWAPAAHHSNTLGSDLSRRSTDEIVRFRHGIRASLDHALCLSILRRIGSGISGGSESSDYFLTNSFASISGGYGRPWWVFAKVQVIGKMVWMASTAPSVNGIEIEIARRFVSLWKSSRDKFRQRFAERIE